MFNTVPALISPIVIGRCPASCQLREKQSSEAKNTQRSDKYSNSSLLLTKRNSAKLSCRGKNHYASRLILSLSTLCKKRPLLTSVRSLDLLTLVLNDNVEEEVFVELFDGYVTLVYVRHSGVYGPPQVSVYHPCRQVLILQYACHSSAEAM